MRNWYYLLLVFMSIGISGCLTEKPDKSQLIESEQAGSLATEDDLAEPSTADGESLGITWVRINDPGIEGHEGFNGEMSKYETTNAQFCQYLNAALACDDIRISEGMVYGKRGPHKGEKYFATKEKFPLSQISFNNGSFSVIAIDGKNMDNYPAIFVTWYGAMAFASYYQWQLPTEWQWQAVADFDGSYKYAYGPTLDKTKANCASANPLGLTNKPYTTPIGHYGEFGYGLCDMSGNVAEWTNSLIYENNDYRVSRGGGWNYLDNLCNVEYRVGKVPWNHDRESFYGFRVCR